MRQLSLLVVVMAVCLTAAASPAPKFSALNAWVGKYPFDKKEKKFRDVLKVPVLKKELAHVLDKKGVARLKKALVLVEPIQKMAGDYVLVEGAGNPKAEPHIEHGFILVKMPEGPMVVAFASEGKLEWFPADAKVDDIPKDIRERIERFK